jgi:DNA invertase Pin-like site-specific DNA recombinase
VFKETASGAEDDRPKRKKVMRLAQGREIDAVLVTELSRWGRSTQGLVKTLDDLHGWKVSVLAQTGLSFDLSTPSGKLMRTIMAGLAEFERDLIRERVKSGLAAAKARGVVLGRQLGQRPSDKRPSGSSPCTGKGFPIAPRSTFDAHWRSGRSCVAQLELLHALAQVITHPTSLRN